MACDVAQRNLGYGYVSRTLETLNIEPGYFCVSNGDLMDKKTGSDRNRKSSKTFKKRRNQLWGQKYTQTVCKEAQEGTTNETAVGLNLDTSINKPRPNENTQIEHLIKNILENELHQCEQIIPTYSAQPNPAKLRFDPTKTYTFVILDTETTCTGKTLRSVCCLQLTKKVSNYRSTFYPLEMLAMELHE